jgi:DNA end-binding protein Ku
MIELASHILDQKAAHFDPSEFKDQYENALKTLVRRKAAGKPVNAAEPEERPSNVVNLMDALKQSLKGGKSGGSKRRGHTTARRSTTHRRPARKTPRSAARHRRAG